MTLEDEKKKEKQDVSSLFFSYMKEFKSLTTVDEVSFSSFSYSVHCQFNFISSRMMNETDALLGYACDFEGYFIILGILCNHSYSLHTCKME